MAAIANADDMLARRRKMVATQIEARGVKHPLVLDAMRRVPRHEFVPKDEVSWAYEDCPLPIGAGQTISQPYIVAFMIEALGLKGGEVVLEVGGGCGYAAAVLSMIADRVISIERIGDLAGLARRNLEAAGIANVDMIHSDGSLGWPDAAPYDAILVSAGAEQVPKPLLDQLKIGGVMVVPVGGGRLQELIRVRRLSEDEYARENLAGVRFVPLIENGEFTSD